MANLVVIGASAGGTSALLEITRRLPPTLPAAVLVVVHIGQNQSHLPRLLNRAGALPAVHAEHDQEMRPGHIYVAPPDFHLLVRDGRLSLSHGPRENHTRPAIDPLFRSAARQHGKDVIGVVLSGALSDGAAGLMAIKARGGRVIVQDPQEALISTMPASAIEAVDVDCVLPVADIAAEIETLLAAIERGRQEGSLMASDSHEETKSLISQDMEEQARDQRAGQLTLFTCPDCGGSLWQSNSKSILGYECHVGHTWSWESLVSQKSEQLETALWASVRLLVERATLNRQLAVRSRDRARNGTLSERFEEQAFRDQEYADLLRQLLETIPGSAALIESENGPPI